MVREEPLFPFHSVLQLAPQMEVVKWTIGAQRYEAYLPTLNSRELVDLVPHCILVKNKGLKAVKTDNHKG